MNDGQVKDERRKSEAAEDRARSGGRGLLVLLIVSLALIVAGVVRCSVELTPGDDATRGSAVGQRSRPESTEAG